MMTRITRYSMFLMSLVSVSLILYADEPAFESWVPPSVIPFPNGSFDEGEAHWFFARERGAQTRATAEYVFTSPGALRVYADHDKGIGARIDSALVPVEGPGPVELHVEVCTFAGRHLGLFIRQYDDEKRYLGIENWSQPGSPTGTWKTNIREVLLDKRTAYIQIRLLPYARAGEVVDMFFDDFRLVRPHMPIPPWPSQYKIRPAETDRLTAADVVGPDGIVYPNWTQVGVQGGIPDVPVVVRLADLGARPDTDIADLLDQACREAGRQGGGAVLIDAGTFFLGRPITIRDSGVVIRGAGKDLTTLVFNYAVGQPGADVGIYWPRKGESIGPDSVVEAHAWHVGLKDFAMYLNDQQVGGVTAVDYGQAQQVAGSALLEMAGAGEATLRVEARYMDGRTATDERVILLSEQSQPVLSGPSIRTLLFFAGNGLEATEHRLAEDGRRGDTVLVFEDAGDLQAGDKLCLHAPGTLRFRQRTQHLVGGDDWKRIGYFEIVARDGQRVTINQPLRIDFPADDGAYGRRLNPIQRCGVEHLSIEHVSRLPVHSIEFDWAWEGWVRNVRVDTSGNSGAHGNRSKRLEIRDSEFDSAWNNDGGQAYGGFTSCQDSLYENCTVTNYRHAPVVQYGANGNVFRNSTFDGSDLQWHAGWSTENLFENCVVNAYRGTGSYGYGAFATGSSDTAHGPNGPRNVVYNCDITSELDGVRLDGVNEHWLFLHNRFVVGKGAGFVATRGSFDHIIRDNVFILQDGVSPMVRLLTPDCVGIDLIGNTLFGGNGQLVAGAVAPAIEHDNRAKPAAAVMAARPQADPPSIYDWQQRMKQSRMGQ